MKNNDRDRLLRDAQLAATYADPRLVVQSSEILALLADLSKLEREQRGVAAALVELGQRAAWAEGRIDELAEAGMVAAERQMRGRAEGLREAVHFLEMRLREAAAQSEGEEGQGVGDS